MIKRLLPFFTLLLFSVGALAAESEPAFVEGKHYERLPEPVRTADPSRIEVVEVFWYGCVHCFHFEPLIDDWKKTLPDDVDFHRSPAMWNPVMAMHAQAFYTAQALGVLDQMHGPLFAALNVDRKKLQSEAELADFFAEHGVSKEDFAKTFNSFGVKSSVKQADARARGYRISGTPEMVVDGKYRVSARTAGGQAEMLKVIDFLVAQERAARAS
jgi:thiol:disulfide interchange protein DsbA